MFMHVTLFKKSSMKDKWIVSDDPQGAGGSLGSVDRAGRSPRIMEGETLYQHVTPPTHTNCSVAMS